MKLQIDDFIVNIPLLADGNIILHDSEAGRLEPSPASESSRSDDPEVLNTMILSGVFLIVGVVVGVLLGAILWRSASHG